MIVPDDARLSQSGGLLGGLDAAGGWRLNVNHFRRPAIEQRFS